MHESAGRVQGMQRWRWHMWSNQTLKEKAGSIAYTADYVLFTCVTALIVGVLVTCLAIMSFGKSGQGWYAQKTSFDVPFISWDIQWLISLHESKVEHMYPAKPSVYTGTLLCEYGIAATWIMRYLLVRRRGPKILSLWRKAKNAKTSTDWSRVSKLLALLDLQPLLLLVIVGDALHHSHLIELK